MSKTQRLSEVWFHRALWLVAIIFAGFLIGLGRLIIGDLPHVQRPITQEQFLQQPATRQTQAAIASQQQSIDRTDDRIAQAKLVVKARQAEVDTAQQNFANWVATRRATGQPNQDADLVNRTHVLDALKAQELASEQTLHTLEQSRLSAAQTSDQLQRKMDGLYKKANQAYASAVRAQELRVFLIRLAFTLPLLLIAAWLFVRKRKGTYWPFVWGFIFFALFAFFVELVPYLPSYGGYVRYIVGLLVTLVAGRFAIRNLQAYLAKQKAEELRPEVERRQDLSYDLAHARLAKKVCPGCERPIQLDDPTRNYCPHCGIVIFDVCVCGARKNAFAHFCPACGRAAAIRPA